MSVRKTTWKNRDGSQGEAWMVCYRDHAGARRFKNFKKKRDADAYHAEVREKLSPHLAADTAAWLAEATAPLRRGA